MSEARSGRLLWTLSFGHLITHWYEGIFYLLIVFIADDLGLTMAQVGILIGFKLWAGVILNMPLGLAVDLIGRRGLLMALSLAWLGLPYGLISTTGTYAVMAACAFLMNVGNQLWHPAAMSTISEVYPHRRGYGLAIHALGASAGDALAPLAAGLLLTALTWREVALINLFPGLVAAPLFWLLFRSYNKQLNSAGANAGGSQTAESGSTEGPRQTYFQRLAGALTGGGQVLRVLVIVGFRGLIQQGMLTFLPFFLVQHLGYPAALVGVYLSAFQTGGLAGSPVSGWLSDRLGRQPVVRVGLLGTAAVLMLMVTVSTGRWTIVPITAVGCFLYAVRPVVQAWALDAMPRELGGAAVGLTFATQALFSSIAPVIGGMIADHYGLMTTFWFLIGVAVLGSVLTYGISVDAAHRKLAKPA